MQEPIIFLAPYEIDLPDGPAVEYTYNWSNHCTPEVDAPTLPNESRTLFTSWLGAPA